VIITLLGSATVTVCYARRTAPGWRFSGDEHDETPQADDNCSFTRTAHELRASSSELDLTLATQVAGFFQWNRTAARGVLACELSLI
jgi:hypothetical protein